MSTQARADACHNNRIHLAEERAALARLPPGFDRNVAIAEERLYAHLVGLDIARCVTRAKDEILADIAAGRVPADVADFAALHDYVDANEYGGMTADAFKLDTSSDVDTWFMQSVQTALDTWLKGGR